jgi:predicted nucleic acid-binding protein
MPKYVIGPDVVLRLAQEQAQLPNDHPLVAPTLLRSQVLALLYQAVRHGTITKQHAGAPLAYVRGLRIRLLGDRVLQSVAWTIADQFGWPDTFDAEYVALAQLHADAVITLNADLASTVQHLVRVAPFEALQGVQKQAG